jgi:hypothetical protein
MDETLRALKSDDVKKLTTPHSTQIEEIDVIEKSLQDFAFSYNKEILQGRAEVALDILNNWQPIILDQVPQESDQELVYIYENYIWLEDILTAALIGWPPTLIETVCLYASEYPDGLTLDNLSIKDTIGLELWGLFASMPTSLSASLPNIASTTLIDDYHDVTPTRGEKFILEVANLLYDVGLIKDDDIPGRNYVLLQESSMLERSQAMLALLEKSGGEVVFEGNQSRFIPADKFWQSGEINSKSRRKKIKKEGILLFNNNKPSCPLMDAAAYLREINSHYVHVKIFPETFKSQQDDTYTLLHTTKILPKGQFHNLFFKEDLSALPQIINLFKKGLENILENEKTYSSWSNFNSEDYAQDNYLENIYPSDKEVIQFAVQELSDRIKDDKLEKITDVGAGGNLYPGLIWTPFVSDSGTITLEEYALQNRDWLKEELQKDRFKDFAEVVKENSQIQDPLQVLKEKGIVKYGSLGNLAKKELDGLSAFFVSEKVTNHNLYIRMMINKMVEAIKPGGVFVFAHQVEAVDYEAGADNLFPTVSIKQDNLKKIYQALDIEYSVKYIPLQGAEKEVKGFPGLIIFVGSKKT